MFKMSTTHKVNSYVSSHVNIIFNRINIVFCRQDEPRQQLTINAWQKLVRAQFIYKLNYRPKSLLYDSLGSVR